MGRPRLTANREGFLPLNYYLRGGGGWDIVSEVTTPRMRMISGTDTERQTNVTVISGGERTTFSVVYNDGKV